MKKFIYSIGIALGCLLSTGAATAAMPTKNAVPARQLKAMASDFSPAQNVSVTKIEDASTKGARMNARRQAPNVDDYFGYWQWSGYNWLTGVILPNEGVMEIRKSDTGPNDVLIFGFEQMSTDMGHGLKGTIDSEGVLRIPRQQVTFPGDIYYDYYGACFFQPYTVANVPDQPGYVNVVESDRDFWFVLSQTEDGSLTITSRIWPQGDEEISDAQWPNYWMNGGTVTEDGSYYWLCGYISGAPLEFFAFNPSEWVHVGNALFKDAWINPILTEPVDAYEVPLYRNLLNDNRYLLLNPYGPDTPFADLNESLKQGFLVFDITDPYCVLFEPFVYSCALDMGTPEEAYIQDFYNYNLEGYYFFIQGFWPEDIQNILSNRGEDVSYFDNGTLHIFNACFDMLPEGVPGQCYSWNNVNSEGYIVFPGYYDSPVDDPDAVTLYMIGDNVNGHNWALAQPDCAFTNLGNGIYRWEGEILGTGFKINDGTWSNDDYNIGAGAGDLILGVPYYYVASSSSGNIAIDGATEVIDPVVVLDLNDGTITVTGEGAGEASWYIMGLNDNWDFIEAYQLLPVDGEDGVFTQVVEIVETAGTCKITDDGWAHERGTHNPEEVMITPTNLSLELEEVFGEAGNIPYELEAGSYEVTWDENNFILTFQKIGGPAAPVYTYFIADGTGTMIRMDEMGQDFYLNGSYNDFLKTGFYIRKDGTDGSIELFGAQAGDEPASLYEPYAYMAYGSDMVQPIPFNGFDLLANVSVSLNTADGTVTLLGGNPYVAGTVNDVYPEALYIVSEDVSGIDRTVPDEFCRFTQVAGGVYAWEGSSLGAFMITDGLGTPLYTIGSAGESLVIGTAFDYAAGLGVKPIEAEGVDTIENPTVVLDLNAWQITVNGKTSEVSAIGAEEDAEAVYFDVHGFRVANPERGGIYVKVSGGKAEKVVM